MRKCIGATHWGCCILRLCIILSRLELILYFSQQSPPFSVWQLVLSTSISLAEKMALSETLIDLYRPAVTFEYFFRQSRRKTKTLGKNTIYRVKICICHWPRLLSVEHAIVSKWLISYSSEKKCYVIVRLDIVFQHIPLWLYYPNLNELKPSLIPNRVDPTWINRSNTEVQKVSRYLDG